ncbi:hypothetical protein U9M48_027565 [Paspalum notatum var. saurae]|uniref:Uncharacterized protein n=1 Tax=Paspalum notatum var. saurae TaxID=547442 RepID=A0AAQ3TT66_PASNO
MASCAPSRRPTAHLTAVVAAACACEEDDDLELLGGEVADDALEPAMRALLVGLGKDDRRM